MSVLKLAPNFAQKSEVLYKLAVIFGKTYQLDHAINYFKLATLESGGAPAVSRRIDILVKMGICHIEKKDYAEAFKSFEAALALNDQNYRTLQHVAWCEFLLKQYPSAIVNITKSIALKTTDADGYYIHGRILLETEKFTEAKEAFTMANKHSASKAIYLASIGIVNSMIKNYGDAFENFLKATQLDNSIPEIWYDIGLLYEIHQQFPEALIAYEKVSEVAPDFKDAESRRKLLKSSPSSTSPQPPFLHPPFRVTDQMVPNKVHLGNQIIRKACDPQYASQIPPSDSLVRIHFNSLGNFL